MSATKVAPKWQPSSALQRTSQATSPSPEAEPSKVEEPLVSPIDSAIVTALPQVFENLRGKELMLLWRASRDGFDSATFHELCDGRCNTLTLVQDTNNFIFGGFTPVAWESQPASEEEEEEEINDGLELKEDDSGRSYLFTLRNPYALPPKRFPLYQNERAGAIRSGRKWGPCFGNGDLWISNEANKNTKSRTRRFGGVYHNSTGRDGRTFFTGMAFFTAKEVEVFEVR
jgi:hypothetical protein